DTARRTNARTAGPIPLPTEINKMTVIRSPFIDKDSREQFEMRTHKRIVDILDPNPRVVDALMRLNLPAGVAVQIQFCSASGGRPPLPEPPLYLGRLGHLRCSPSGLHAASVIQGRSTHTLGPSPCLRHPGVLPDGEEGASRT